MANFCTNCGRPLDAGAAFCGSCGAPVAGAVRPPQVPPPQGETFPQAQTAQRFPQEAQQPAPQRYADPRFSEARVAQAWEQHRSGERATEFRRPQNGGPTYDWMRAGIPAPGWSSRINDPALAAALAKQRKASKRVAGFIVPIPLVGFAIYGLLSDTMEFPRALLYGAVISAVFLIFSWIGKRQSSGKNAYEGVVVDKRTRYRSRRGGETGWNELITVVRTTAGEQKQIVERDNSRTPAWEYLQIGDQFRYHPELAFPYELFDKSRAPYLPCPICQKKNPLANDNCSKCGAPLLK